MTEDEPEAFETALRAVNPANFEALLLRASEKPFQVALECQATLSVLEKTFEKPLNQILAVGYCVACRLRQSPLELEKFTSSGHWSHPYRKAPEGDALLRMVFRFYKNAWSRGSDYDTACRWTAALSHFFKNEIEPSEIPALIKLNGGIEKLYETEIRVRKWDEPNDLRRQPHRNSAVPRSLEKIFSMQDELRSLPTVTDQEETLIKLLAKLHGAVVDFIRQRHQQDEEDWLQEVAEASGR